MGFRRKMSDKVSVSDFEYVDDMGLVSDTMDVLEEALRVLNGLCVRMGLTINARKTKTLAVHPTCTHSATP